MMQTELKQTILKQSTVVIPFISENSAKDTQYMGQKPCEYKNTTLKMQ